MLIHRIMKRLLFLLFLIPALAFGQSVYTYSGKVATYGGDVIISPVSAYCAEYQAVYDAYTTKPDPVYAAIDNTMVAGLVSDGVWAKLDVMWVYAVHTNGAGEALINWPNPGTFDATAFNAPTFTAYQGFLGNGTTQYINTGGWIPSVNGVNYTQNSASMIIYTRNDITSYGNHGTFENVDNKDTRINLRHPAGSSYSNINSNGAMASVVGASNGMNITTRLASNVTKEYRNKVEVGSDVDASTGAPTHSPYSLAYNDDDVAKGFRADQVSLYAFGAGMTQTDVNNLTDRFETRMDALGTGVIAYNPLEDLMLLHYLALKIRIEKYENTYININP